MKKEERKTNKHLKTNDNKKGKINKKNKKDKIKFSQKHPKVALILRIIILLLIAMIVVGTAIVIGMMYGVWGQDFEISKEALSIGSANSIVVDSNGNQIAELTGDENRKIIRLDQMPDNLKNAYVAIEDERFYEHSGVDLKRTTAAILQYVIHRGSSSFGGSTITQQLVKNLTKDDDRSGTAGIMRKVKEWVKAYQIERMISKDQILELYLNIIFVGSNNYGVEVGAEYYFGKSASELDLAQCAFLAGINNSPNSYNPYGSTDNSTKIKNRTETVLKKMLELGKISQEDYDAAYNEVEAGLTFQKGNTTGGIYSYHTDATIAQVIEDVANEKNMNTSAATAYVYSAGLTIYSTQNTEIQSQMDEVMVSEYSKYNKKSSSGTDAESAMVIIDNSTGYVVAVDGGLGAKTEARGLNRATQSTRQTGSSIKPLTSLVPGINEGIITAATIYDDNATDFNGWTPKDYNAFKGLISIRSAVTTSQNIPFAKVVTELTPEKATEYLEKMGVTSIDKSKDGIAALSIGGFTNGISPLQMAGAYATIANNGVYRTPLFYTKVTDSKGDTVIEAKQETEQVISEQAAYVVKNLLQSVVNSGTATYCKISGIDVAAKTGTTNSNYDKWLCGFTNYYTATTWYGYDSNEEVAGNTNWAGKIWSSVMSKVHVGKENSSFNVPSGIVTETICKTSGKKATSKCSDTYSEIFVEGTVPEECNGHSNSVEVCSDTGLLANEYCPNKVSKYYSYIVDKEKLGLWKSLSSSSTSAPTSYCTEHNKNNTGSTAGSDEPKITLKGDKNITLNINDSYTEKGATATDETDGDISSKIAISGTVNTSKAGTYTISYSVTNSKGKTAKVERTITVKDVEAKKEEKEETKKEEAKNETATNSTDEKNETKDGDEKEQEVN